MNEIVEKIQEKGYWRVVIRPTREFYNEKTFELNELTKILQDAQVRLRGWYYPHIHEPQVVAQNKIGESVDYEGLIEYWEFSTAGHFGHIFSMREDYIIDEQNATKIKSSFPFSKDKASPVSKFFEVVSTIYRFTEIYFFVSKLVQSPKFQDVGKFEIIIELHGVKDRMLYISDTFRNLWQPYVCAIPDDKIIFNQKYDKDELIAKFDTIALSRLIDTFKYFNWPDPSEQVIREDQKKLLERRL